MTLPTDDGGKRNSIPTSALTFLDDDEHIDGASTGFSYVFDRATGALLREGSSGALLEQNPIVGSASGVDLLASGELRVQSRGWVMQPGESLSTPLGPATGLALREDGRVAAILGSQGVGLISTEERGLLNDSVPRRGAVSLSLDPSGDRIVHDYVFASGSTSVFQRASGGEWSETVVASGGAMASGGIPFAEERFEAQFDLRGMADSMAGQFLDRATGEVVGEVPLAPTAMRVGEELIAVGTDDGIVTIHRYPSGEPVRVLDDWVNLADSEPAAGLVATFSTLEYNLSTPRAPVSSLCGVG